MQLSKDKLNGISVLVLSHSFSVGAGIYDGYCEKYTSSLFFPFMINMAGTAFAYTLIFNDDGNEKKVLEEILAGALMGGVTSPIEYFIGKGIGSIAKYIF